LIVTALTPGEYRTDAPNHPSGEPIPVKLAHLRKLLLALCAGLALAGVAQSSTTPSPTPAQAFADLNAWRTQAGEARVLRFTSAYDTGCALHDNYMNLLGHLIHPETPGRPGYTAAGADAGPNSVLAEPEGLPEASWVDSVYHRMGVLQPRLRVSGFSATDGYVCLRVGGPAVDNSLAARTPKLTLYPWPPNGSTDQPVTWGHAVGETPSPLTDAPGASSLGLLLSVDVNGPWSDYRMPLSKVTSASLVSSDGVSVPIAISDSTSRNGGYLSGGFGLFARTALNPGTRYTAHAIGSVTALGIAYPFDFSWHFTTKVACTAPEIVAPSGVSIPTTLKFSFPVSLTCNGDTLAGEQISASIVQGGTSTPLPTFSTSDEPTTLTVSISASGPQQLVLRFAGGKGLQPATADISLSYS
jgi:hypothetical protein